jgi:hypothetical protein
MEGHFLQCALSGSLTQTFTFPLQPATLAAGEEPTFQATRKPPQPPQPPPPKTGVLITTPNPSLGDGGTGLNAGDVLAMVKQAMAAIMNLAGTITAEEEAETDRGVCVINTSCYSTELRTQVAMVMTKLDAMSVVIDATSSRVAQGKVRTEQYEEVEAPPRNITKRSHFHSLMDNTSPPKQLNELRYLVETKYREALYSGESIEESPVLTNVTLMHLGLWSGLLTLNRTVGRQSRAIEEIRLISTLDQIISFQYGLTTV